MMAVAVFLAMFMIVMMTVDVFLAMFMIMTVTVFLSMFMIVMMAVTVFLAMFMIVMMTVVVFLTVFMIVMMAVTMIMLILFQMNIKIICIQPRNHFPPKMQVIAFHPQTSKRLFQYLSVSTQIQQRPNCHISAYPRITLQIQYFSHNYFTANRFICVARYPAPYPLSILTTEIPFAQEFNIVKRADNP